MVNVYTDGAKVAAGLVPLAGIAQLCMAPLKVATSPAAENRRPAQPCESLFTKSPPDSVKVSTTVSSGASNIVPPQFTATFAPAEYAQAPANFAASSPPPPPETTAPNTNQL